MVPVVSLCLWFRSQYCNDVASETFGVDRRIDRQALRLDKVRQGKQVETLPHIFSRVGTIGYRIFPHRIGESLARLRARLIFRVEKDLLPGASHQPVRLSPLFRVLIEAGSGAFENVQRGDGLAPFDEALSFEAAYRRIVLSCPTQLVRQLVQQVELTRLTQLMSNPEAFIEIWLTSLEFINERVGRAAQTVPLCCRG